MIAGLGIDIAEISRFKSAVERNEIFASKVLTPAELLVYDNYQGIQAFEYLGGRFSAKEAFSKALGTGIGYVGFQDIEILNDDKGKPYIVQNVFSGKVHISISHTAGIVMTEVILERQDVK